MKLTSTAVAATFGGCLFFLACNLTGSAGTSIANDPNLELTVTSSTTVENSTMPSPEQAHILDGQWLFTYVLESYSDNFSPSLDPGDIDLFIVTMSPTCEIGPCDVRTQFYSPYREETTAEPTIVWSGDDYVLTTVFPALGNCSADDDDFIEGGLDLKVTIRLSPTEYDEANGLWRATGLEGTRTADWIPNEPAESQGCEPSVERYSVTAVPYDPSRFNVPVSEPLPPGSLTFRQRGPAGEGLMVRLPDGSERFVHGVSTPYVVSPDGASVVYRGTLGLWIMGLDGSGAHEFFPQGRVLPSSDIAWSSDGSEVAVVRRNLDEGADVWIVEVPYGVPERLTWGGGALGGVAWGPGDNSLLFDWGVYDEVPGNPSTFTVQSKIFTYDFESDEIAEVAANGFRPSIGAGGDSLTYLVPDLDRFGGPSRWSVTLSDPDGDNARVLFRAALSYCGVGTRPVPCSAALSPDGSQIAFSDNNWCNDCSVDAIDGIGVWLFDVETKQVSAIADAGHQPQWVP